MQNSLSSQCCSKSCRRRAPLARSFQARLDGTEHHAQAGRGSIAFVLLPSKLPVAFPGRRLHQHDPSRLLRPSPSLVSSAHRGVKVGAWQKCARPKSPGPARPGYQNHRDGDLHRSDPLQPPDGFGRRSVARFSSRGAISPSTHWRPPGAYQGRRHRRPPPVLIAHAGE
jgi:hypothetical protein